MNPIDGSIHWDVAMWSITGLALVYLILNIWMDPPWGDFDGTA